jgi:sarcosine oxidase subunit alpha
MTDLMHGMVARRQNAWPSVELDLMAVNSLAAPLLTAGFYYKTFMGPRRGSWMFYEPFIRRAAGLGAGTYERDPDRYETRHEFADVLVVGSGPAGLAAALAAGRSGARVVLVDQDSLAGGAHRRPLRRLANRPSRRVERLAQCLDPAAHHGARPL